MSQETPIGNLSGGISEEDAKLVDSILNDLGQGPQQAQPQQPQQAMSQEHQALLAQRQALAQQAIQKKAMQQVTQKSGPQIAGGSGSSVADIIKRESKSIMVIIVLSIVFNLGQVNTLFKKISLFVGQDGVLNLQCVFVKALLIGLIYFFIKKQIA